MYSNNSNVKLKIVTLEDFLKLITSISVNFIVIKIVSFLLKFTYILSVFYTEHVPHTAPNSPVTTSNFEQLSIYCSWVLWLPPSLALSFQIFVVSPLFFWLYVTHSSEANPKKNKEGKEGKVTTTLHYIYKKQLFNNWLPHSQYLKALDITYQTSYNCYLLQKLN